MKHFVVINCTHCNATDTFDSHPSFNWYLWTALPIKYQILNFTVIDFYYQEPKEQIKYIHIISRSNQFFSNGASTHRSLTLFQECFSRVFLFNALPHDNNTLPPTCWFSQSFTLNINESSNTGHLFHYVNCILIGTANGMINLTTIWLPTLPSDRSSH